MTSLNEDMILTDIKKIADQTAIGIALAYRNGETNPVELTEYFLDRIDKASQSNIFITITRERALKEAKAAAVRYHDGRPCSALDGVPIAWKDLFDVAGSPTTAGSILYKGSAAKSRDATCVANIAAAGMVCLGKLNMTEFAYSGIGLNMHFGTSVNPNDKKTYRSPGGSSSGSGAAVAAGLVPCAIGTDTGGSVRIPASLNGTVGLKTSEGRINKTGMIPLSRTLDTVGPLGRSVEDCIALDMALRGAPYADVNRADIRDLKIVVPTNIVLEGADAAVLENFENSIEELVKAGATIERRKVDALDQATDITKKHGSLAAAESYHEYHDMVEGADGSRIDPRVLHRIVMGGKMTAHDLLSIQNGREHVIMGLEADLAGALLAMPTTPITAPKIKPLEADMDLFHKVNLLLLRNTMLGNFLRLCGLTIPNGRDKNNLPTAFLLSGISGHDNRIMGFGMEIDRILSPSFQPTWIGN